VEEDRECGTVNVSRGSGGGGREGSWRCRWGFEGGEGVASWRRGGGEGTGLGWLRFSGRGATAAGPGGGAMRRVFQGRGRRFYVRALGRVCVKIDYAAGENLINRAEANKGPEGPGWQCK
jgi:hypothetical protein